MEITNEGLTLSDLNDILNDAENTLQSTYGADFYIKPEGVIDNIFTSAGFMEMDLQEQIAFLIKQFDPESAEGVWQDALYERIGIQRFQAEPTTFQMRVLGVEGFNGVKGDITIRSDLTQEEYINTSDYIVTSNGAILTFECVVAGATNVLETETFKIVTSPEQITGLSTSNITNIDIGRDRETDDEFRIRFRSAKAYNSKATRNANIANLLKYVDNEVFLEILDKKNDVTFTAGTMEVIAKHNTTDEIFADAIFNTVADGIDLLGNTTINVQDNAGETVEIKFYKALEPEILFNIVVSLKNGYVQSTIFNNIKQSIINYTKNTHIFGLKSIIFATEFVVPILNTEGVAAVNSIQIKRSTDVNYADSLQMTQFEVPLFNSDNITISENS